MQRWHENGSRRWSQSTTHEIEMIYARAGVSGRWISICICFGLLIYLYRNTPAAWKPKTSHKPSKRPEKHDTAGKGGSASRSRASSSEILNKSIEGLDSWVYDPYPNYNSAQWSHEWKGRHVSCLGPRGVPVNREADDMLMAYHSTSAESSQPPMFGSYEDTGLDSETCFTSNTRYRPYGYTEEGEEEGGGGEVVKGSALSEVVWEDVKWGDLQKNCVINNRDRYVDIGSINQSTIFQYAGHSDLTNFNETLYYPEDSEKSKSQVKKGRKFKRRSAVVFQIQESKEWTLDTTQYMRSVIMELSLHTGGEYEVFILVEVAEDSQPIFDNPLVSQRIKEHAVPREFQDITFLFNHKLLKERYPKTQKTNSEDRPSHTYAPLQLLSLARPDIEFFWRMDVEARYTGHHYDHLEAISTWSKARPREFLWELASQVYMKQVHKTWESFTKTVKNSARKSTVRGPLKTKGIRPVGPEPPMMLRGKDEWGIGEDADLITLGPVFDPVDSSFQAKEEVENYEDGVKGTPRRATPFPTMTRISKCLLRAMHHGQVSLGSHLAPSMFPASTALHHGLKVVAFPLPIFLDAIVKPEQVEKEFNFGWGRYTYDTPFKYTDFWRRMTFSISIDEESTYADELYKRWLGYDETRTQGLCLPGLLLNPIHGV